MNRMIRMVSALLLGLLSPISFAHKAVAQFKYGYPLRADETIIFFPTSSHDLNPVKKGITQCEIPIHSWLFEPEDESLARKSAVKLVGELLEHYALSEEESESDIFRQRITPFLVDNQRNKKVSITLNDKPYVLNKTHANGHSKTSITMDCWSSGWKTFKLNMPVGDKRSFTGKVLRIPPKGISVISDIDDTIKISEVLNKKALLRHTFAEPFKTTPGMPDYYKKLESKGVYFHYVSSSPWQLYPSLGAFINDYYPPGTVSLRNFRVKDTSLIDFITASKEYKLEKVKSIIQRYPQHQFILIGDSGENDPEVYASMAEEFPNNIMAVLIRRVEKSDLSEQRIAKVCKKIKGYCQFFRKVEDIKLEL